MDRFFLALALLIVWGGAVRLAAWRDDREALASTTLSLDLVVSDEQTYHFPAVSPGTVGDFLAQSGFHTRPEDRVFPARETALVPGQTIWYTPARAIVLKTDRTERGILTLKATAAEILEEAQVSVDADDIVDPPRLATVSEGEMISVTRVEVREEAKDTPIAFETQVTEDGELSWRQRRVTQRGENGVKRTVYRVAVHDGREVSRRITTTETIKPPVPERVVQGTLVKIGKTHRGAASWYAWTGTLSAANPWLPLGSFVRVTNQENGKSVIVKINDRGPFVPGRIIDLDRVAFQKIASPGAGVIEVKMEEIVN